MILVLIGPSGCGKGTQAKLLSENYDLPIITMSDLLKARVAKSDDALSQKIKDTMARGVFVDGAVSSNLLVEYLQETKLFEFILDGTHRTLEQVIRNDYLLKMTGLRVDKAIIFELSEEESVNRILSRSRERMAAGIQPRNDDMDTDAIKTRLKEYNKEVDLIKMFYEMQGNNLYINASNSIDMIFEEIVKNLKL